MSNETTGKLAIAMIALIILGILWVYYPRLSEMITESPVINESTNRSTTSTAEQPSYTVYSPEIISGNANITFPQDYRVLANYALSIINQDRAKYGLQGVSLSSNLVAQQHANSMLFFGYFSHEDTQGFKPYMRYTLLGGRGAVEENVAYEFWTGPHFFKTEDVEKAIKNLEYQMMYNDTICCNDGHKKNILNPLHNRVSIGIAYNRTTVYFVQDFENYYIDMVLSLSTDSISIKGTLLSPIKVSEIAIFFDPIPTPITISQLRASPHEYDPGKFLGGILPPCNISCPYFPGAITVYANTWQLNSSMVNIEFSVGKFIRNYGDGVYTIYMLTDHDISSAITSISIFVKHQ